MYQVFVPGIFFYENVKRSFENLPGFKYRVGESTRLKVPRPGTFLQNLVKKKPMVLGRFEAFFFSAINSLKSI